MKYKNGIVSDIKKKKEFQASQEQLREKYHLQNKKEDVVIVEKNNMAKFTVKTVTTLIRSLATIIILILAAIGLMTLLYPELRTAFSTIIHGLFAQLQGV